MTALSRQLDATGRFLHRHRALLLPLVALSLVLVVLMPVPPVVLDALLACNIAAAALVLLTVIHVRRPTDFSVFPALLLMTTLVRLVLNVASTRLILTAGDRAADPQTAQLAAGHVIWAFSHFVTADSLAVGAILFAILVVIQLVVVTKGATRISEVSARFALDAMPGRQMAIDADLRSGAIDAATAARCRSELAAEADFYGAMDGASKFLRGDAAAAVIITVINIVGGLLVGAWQYGWSWQESMRLFTRLTIGDGLVTQVPAFVLSISAGLLVTRNSARSQLGETMVSQLSARPVTLALTAGFLVALTMTSLPKLPLLMLAGGLGLAAELIRRRRGAEEACEPQAEPATDTAPGDGEWQDLLHVEPVTVELGYALLPLAEGDGAPLPGQIAETRRRLAREIGLIAPAVRVRDSLRGGAHRYAIAIRGQVVAEGRLRPGQLLAVAAGPVTGKLTGTEAVEPASGAPAVWIHPTRSGAAERMNYRLMRPAEVLAGHLGEVIRHHAAAMLTRQQTAALLDAWAHRAGQVVEEVRGRLSVGKVQKVLQALLGEAHSIRDLEAILEAISDAAETTDDVGELIDRVRRQLAWQCLHTYRSADGQLWCVQLDAAATPELAVAGERATALAVDAPTGQPLALAAGGAEGDPALRDACDRLADHLAELQAQGRKPVVLCPANLCGAVRRTLARIAPDAAVLSEDQVQPTHVHPIAKVGYQP